MERPVRVNVFARSVSQAEALANRVVQYMKPHLMGPPTRVMAFNQVADDAPESGVIEITTLP